MCQLLINVSAALPNLVVWCGEYQMCQPKPRLLLWHALIARIAVINTLCCRNSPSSFRGVRSAVPAGGTKQCKCCYQLARQDKILPANIFDKVLHIVIVLLPDCWQPFFFTISWDELAAASGGFSGSSWARWHLLRCHQGCGLLMLSILKLKNVKQLLHFLPSRDLCALPLFCCRNGRDTQQPWAMLSQQPTCDIPRWRENYHL